MEFTSLTSLGDQSLSAMAAVVGQTRESTVSGPTNSAHMQASPPMMRVSCSGVSVGRGAALAPRPLGAGGAGVRGSIP